MRPQCGAIGSHNTQEGGGLNNPFSPFWSFYSHHHTTYICEHQLFSITLQPQKKKMKVYVEYKRVLFSIIMLAVLTFNAAASTLFIHSHIIDGKEVVHSHPYSGPVSSHTHSKSHLQSINEAQHRLSITSESTSHLGAPLAVIIKEYNIYCDHILESEHATSSLRGPPSLV